MDTKKLRQKILDLAIRGKLVPQDPNDEPASVLLERIKAEKEQLIKAGIIKRSKQSASSDTFPYENVPFEIPKSWVWTTIGDVCETCLGKMLDKQKNQGILQPYLRNVNVRWGKFDLSDLLQMPFEDSEAERYSIGQNDLVVCEGGEPGRCAIWVDAEPIKFQKALHRVRCSDGILNKYIHIILKTFYTSGMLESYYTGSTIKHLTGDSLNSLLFPLPPTKEQFRIVDEVEKWEDVLDALDKEGNELSSAIQQIKSRILDLAIHGKLVPQDPNDEPAIELLRRINPDFQPCDNAHYKNLPFAIPNTWVWVKHNDILEISGGAQPAKSYFSSFQLPNYIRLYQIRDYGDTPIPVYIPIELASKQTRKGDILLARYGGSLGKVFIAEEGAYNVAMAKIIFKYANLINKDYAYYYYLSSIYQNKLKEISRTAQVGFNSADFNEMFFPLPPLEEQKRIVKKIRKYNSLIDNIIAEL